MKIFFPIALDRAISPIALLLREIARHNPQLSFFGCSNPLSDEDKRLASSLWSLPNLTSIRPWEAIWRRFDIVHHASVTPKNFYLSRLVKLVSMGHSSHLLTANCEPYSTDIYLEWYRRAAGLADEVVAVSQAVSNSLAREFGVQCRSVIPNGFDADFYNIPSDVEMEGGGIRTGSKSYVLFVSAIRDRKRPDFILSLARRLPEIDFVMVGPMYDPALAEVIRRDADKVPNVQLLGEKTRSEVRDLMHGACVLCHPSEFEGLPLSVIEALGSGLPVIAQPKSSLPELVQVGVNGWLYDLESIDRWVERICEIVKWDAVAVGNGAMAARDSVMRFRWESVAAQYAQLYQELSD